MSNRDNLLLKSKITEDALKQPNPFSFAIKATLGFYVGQLIATLLGLVVIGLIISIAYLVIKN